MLLQKSRKHVSFLLGQMAIVCHGSLRLVVVAYGQHTIVHLPAFFNSSGALQTLIYHAISYKIRLANYFYILASMVVD